MVYLCLCLTPPPIYKHYRRATWARRGCSSRGAPPSRRWTGTGRAPCCWRVWRGSWRRRSCWWRRPRCVDGGWWYGGDHSLGPSSCLHQPTNQPFTPRTPNQNAGRPGAGGRRRGHPADGGGRRRVRRRGGLPAGARRGPAAAEPGMVVFGCMCVYYVWPVWGPVGFPLQGAALYTSTHPKHKHTNTRQHPTVTTGGQDSAALGGAARGAPGLPRAAAGEGRRT